MHNKDRNLTTQVNYQLNFYKHMISFHRFTRHYLQDQENIIGKLEH